MALHFCDNLEDLKSSIISLSLSEVYVVTDDLCYTHCLPAILKSQIVEANNIFVIPHGEENKTAETYLKGIDFLSERYATRSATILNIGGGITTDLGGFISSTYKRGISFVNIPTSLMAMVDAANGGKVGVNHKNLKNYIGSFLEPNHVVIYPPFLSTLPKAEILSGFAEVLKHGLIADKLYWDTIKNENPEQMSNDSWLNIIQKSIAIKNSIVSSDSKEKGVRKTLNYGHTVGHAIETHLLNNGTSISHGQAVAAGMITEGLIANHLNQLSNDELTDVITHINKLFGKLDLNSSDVAPLVSLMRFDKKNSEDHIEMALLNGIGNCNYGVVVEDILIEQYLTTYIEM
jgi:3-dehydroquinate synthase